MAIFSSPSSSKKDPAPAPAPVAAPQPPANVAAAAPPRPAGDAPARESVIAADLTIEGKIEGTGHIRIAGKFKGDVNVQGDLGIDRGAKVTGGVRAKKVIVAGDLEGNIDAAVRVELTETATLIGDLKAATLSVSPGARIRGHVDCGWDAAQAVKPAAAPPAPSPATEPANRG